MQVENLEHIYERVLKKDYPQSDGIPQRFEAQVERTPDAVAVVCNDKYLIYRELNRRANQLACYLRAFGVAPEVLVGICVERSLEMVVGLLAILKAGGAFVPLDPTYPRERLAFMLQDSQVPVVLTEKRFVEDLPKPGVRVVQLDADAKAIGQQSEDDPISGVQAESPAYVIYTSGSTGAPKGVIGLHRGAVNRLNWMWDTYPFAAGEVCCQKTSLNFVDSVGEIFGPLLQGIQMVIIPDEVLKDPQHLIQSLATEHVTRIVVVPSLLRLLMHTSADLQNRLPNLKIWITSGEALSPELTQRFLEKMPHIILLNLYGSSEVSGDSTWYEARKGKTLPCVPIGRRIANTQIYLLDRDLQPVPLGSRGELYIGGDGLARGYLNRPELTAEKFIPNPFNDAPGTRLYRTGDLARYLPDGQIEFLGRIDHQVKIRGLRVELEEIEVALGQHPAVEEAIVLAKEHTPGDTRLVAYVVPNSAKTPTTHDLRVFLREKLPEFMLPSAFRLLDSLPLTPNGKVDRYGLAVLERKTRPELNEAFVAPRTPLESVIAEIWQDVLGVDQVSVYDNFFDLGGHSLLVMLVIARLKNKVELRIHPNEFMFQTLGQLAAACEEQMRLLKPLVPMSVTQKIFQALQRAISHRRDAHT